MCSMMFLGVRFIRWRSLFMLCTIVWTLFLTGIYLTSVSRESVCSDSCFEVRSTEMSECVPSSLPHGEMGSQSGQNNSSTLMSKGMSTNIVFLKIHKSGSSTIANLLARYALSHDLNVALPNKPKNIDRFNYFDHLQEQYITPLTEGQQFNVAFNHMIYNRTALDLIMPRNTFYCAIMREPLSRFISAAGYYRYLLPAGVRSYLLDNAQTADEPQKQSLNEEEESLQESEAKQDYKGLAALLTGRAKKVIEGYPEIYNSIASDSGLPIGNHMNVTAVKEHTDKLDRELHLVMIMERFQESLVLLKRRACLSFKDILYFKLNSANRHVWKFTDSDKNFVRAWQMADNMLYQHFSAKFNAEVQKEGGSFPQEVEHFEKIQNRMRKFCAGTSSKMSDVLVVEASKWNDKFTLNGEDCNTMQLNELEFQRRLLHRARTRYLEGVRS